MIDDGTVFRLAKDNFRWIGGQEYGGTWLRELAKKKNYKAWVKSSTDQIHIHKKLNQLQYEPYLKLLNLKV